MQHALGARITGFVLSLILTLAAYYVILHPEFFQFDVKMAVIVIFALAIIQSLVQLIFFIHVWKEDGAFWNLSVFISTVSIIFIIIYFSIWIIEHLNYNMR
jgi:cytochrome o ubiquinol oxidase operon protein cyoD